MRQLETTGTGQRLDLLLAGDGLSRSQAAKAIREGLVTVQGIVVTKPSFVADEGAKVVLTLPEVADSAPVAEDIPISVVFEDDALAVVNKPAGLVVHPAAGNPGGTLVNALLHRMDRLSTQGGADRPGIVHRLDKDTSGLMLVAKNDQAHLALSKALASRQIDKHYLTVVAGRMKEEAGSFDGPIGRNPKDRKKMAVVPDGRDALTHYQVLHQEEKQALLLIALVTGRTHQIRVHFANAHHPVLGDPIYGHKRMPPAPRLMLHAFRLGFHHPVTGEAMAFHAMPEEAFKAPPESEILKHIH